MLVLRNLVLVGAAAVATSASAVPIVTQWSYSITSFFTGNVTYSNGLQAVGAGPCPDGNPTCSSPEVLSWGTAAPQQSRLVITGNPAVGVITTDTDNNLLNPPTDIGPAQIFTHFNFPIFDPVLLEATVTATLTLMPLAPPGPLFPPQPTTFEILFNETPNVAAPGVCLIAPLNPANPCPDIFVVQGSFNLAPFFYDTDGPGPATPDQYFIQIFPNPLNPLTPLVPLPDAACASVGANPGCIGFVTEENQSNSVQFAFAITAQPFQLTPEPSMLALFAIGLFGLGFTARRRQA